MNKDEALKMAIDVLQNYAQADSPVWRKALYACKEALEQPAQHNFCSRCGKRASKDPNHIHTCTPPHQWQGLTDDEIHNVADTIDNIEYACEYINVIDFACAIEQALKDKNT